MATKYLNKLHNKRVLVIGGTSGIGYAVAEAAVEYGADVTVASSQQTNVDRAVKDLKTAYPNALDRIRGHVCDLSADAIEENLRTLFDFATNNNTDKLDHIVDTAGDSVGRITLDTANPSEYHRITKVRVIGPILIAKLGREYFHQAYTSSITLTGGVNAYKPLAGWSVLSSVSGAKDSLTRGLAKDLAPIRVNLVSPGAIHTPLVEKFVPGHGIERLQKAFGGMSLQGRIGAPDEIAEAYLALMKNYFQTGTTVQSEGGYLLM
jgi:NAD(P)-dependent dehydrogenase (short-subunit alcohol dehydrogenase family)